MAFVTYDLALVGELTGSKHGYDCLLSDSLVYCVSSTKHGTLGKTELLTLRDNAAIARMAARSKTKH